MTLLKSTLSTSHRPYGAEYRRQGYITNGWDKLIRWDGQAGSTVLAGIAGPSTDLDSWTPSPTTAAGDTSLGVHAFRYRYMDSKTGYVSNPSEERELIVASGAEQLTFPINTGTATNIIRSTDAKVDTIIVEMTTVDGSVFYTAATVLNTASTVVVDIIDNELEAKLLPYPALGHYPPLVTKYISSHRSRLWLYGQVVHSTGTATFTNSSVDVAEGSTDPDWRASALGDATASPVTEKDVAWFIQMDGDALSWEVDYYDESLSKIVLKTAYVGTGGTNVAYKLFARTNTIWVSRAAYPEGFEPFKFLNGYDGELAGNLTAGLGYGSGMLFWSQNTMFRLTWETDPTVDPLLVPISTKYGALNNNTVIEVEGTVYSMDRQGIQSWQGTVPQHISRPVDSILRDNVSYDNPENFHCAWYPKIRAIRFFVCYASDSDTVYPRHYLQLDVDTGAWSAGSFYQGISYSRLVPTSDGLAVIYGDENGHLWFADEGTSDGCPADYTHQRVGPNPTTTVLTMETELPTDGHGVTGCYAYWLEGAEARLITANTAYTVTCSAFSSAPTGGDTIWIGPIKSKLRTRAYRPDSPDQKMSKGYFVLSYVPETTEGIGAGIDTRRLLQVRAYENRASTAKGWRSGENMRGVTWPGQDDRYPDTDALFNLHHDDGVVEFPMGKKWSRFLEVELEIQEPDAVVEILDLGLRVVSRKKAGT
jgi:hypothetical protein